MILLLRKSHRPSMTVITAKSKTYYQDNDPVVVPLLHLQNICNSLVFMQ